MGRPPHERFVERLPRSALFKPAGIPARELQHVGLTVDEVETLRLVDLGGLSHEEAAESLGVSRQTAGRVLETARRKVADALVNGKALAIGGGAYQLARGRCCDACGWRWQAPAEDGSGAAAETCPACGSTAVRPCTGPGGGGGRGRHGQGACGGPHGRGRGCLGGPRCWDSPHTAGDEPAAPS